MKCVFCFAILTYRKKSNGQTKLLVIIIVIIVQKDR